MTSENEIENNNVTVEVDMINSPSHYKVTLAGNFGVNYDVDCLEIIEALGFNKEHYIASAFAYIWRCLKKGDTLQDLNKALYYLNREIELREHDSISGFGLRDC